MSIIQGDSYSLGIKLTSDGDIITPDLVAEIQFILGKLEKFYKPYESGEVVYNSESQSYEFPLTQAETYSMQGGAKLQVRTKFLSGVIIGSRPMAVDVINSITATVL
jgi:hypothetical protein